MGLLRKMTSKISGLMQSANRELKWKKANPDNDTRLLGDPLNIDIASVGNQTYGRIFINGYGSDGAVKIGAFCSIAPQVAFVTGNEHALDRISTFPFKVKTLETESNETLSKGGIVVDDDVWIGFRATILDGVHIGQGAVIAAGALVTKDVPPYAIVGGVPAKVISYRFDKDLIEALLQVDYSQLTSELIKENIDALYEPLTNAKQLAWMPKKASGQ